MLASRQKQFKLTRRLKSNTSIGKTVGGEFAQRYITSFILKYKKYQNLIAIEAQ